jgi:hypothetical protein
MRLAVGDKVRVYYYPANSKRSFVEGVVQTVAIPTSRGPVFVIDVTCEVVFGREQPIRRRHQTYVRYERGDEFPGRIEVLSRAEAEPALEPEPENELASQEQQTETDSMTEEALGPDVTPEPAPDLEVEASQEDGRSPSPG